MPAAAMPWIAPTAIGALGLMQGANNARAGQGIANAGLAIEQQKAAAQMAAYNARMDLYKSNVKSGVYTPDSQIKTYRAALDRNQQIVSQNMAGQAATMGYRPGDTAPLDAMGTQANDYKLREAQGEQSITQSVRAQQQSDLAGLSGGSSVLGGGGQIMNYGGNLAGQGNTQIGGALDYIGKIKYPGSTPQIGNVATSTGVIKPYDPYLNS